jgi:hypothetical protein
MTRSVDRERARALFGPPEAAPPEPSESPSPDPAPEAATPAGTAADARETADARVVALLRDAVPPVPDAPGRLAAVRARAGHQRSTLWSQVIGAAAAVLLVTGVAAAIGAPRPGEIRPSSRPFAHLAEKLASQTSVSFELTSRRLSNQSGEPASGAATSVATGAFARNGDMRLDGNLGMLAIASGGLGNLSMRSVGGVLYRGVTPFEHPPAGKLWVREEIESTPAPSSADITGLVRKAVGYASNVHYVRQGVVRGTKVAEYVVTVPGHYLDGDDLSVSVALDADGLPRRLSADLSLRQLMAIASQSDDGYHMSGVSPSSVPDYVVHAELELFDYGRPVDVTPPPASQVITAEELRDLQEKRFAHAQADYEACIRKAHEAADMRACDKLLSGAYEVGIGTAPPQSSPKKCTTTTQPDGSKQTICEQSTFVTSGRSSAVTLTPASPSPAP